MNVTQRVALNTAVQLGARAVSVACMLVSFALVTRHLGVDGFGGYALVLTFTALAVAVSDLGLTPVAVRELAARPEQTESLVSDLLGLRVLIAVSASALMLIIAALAPYESRVRTGIAVAAIAVFVLVLAGVPGIVFQSRQRLDLAAAVELVSSTTGLGLVVALVIADRGLVALVLAAVAAAAAGTAVAYALAARAVPMRPRFRRSQLRRLLADALPVGVFALFGIVHFRVDTLLLSLLKPLEDVGTYSAAYRFLEQVIFVPGFFVAAAYPVLAAFVATGDPRLVPGVRKALSFLLAVAAPIAVASAILADELVPVVAGDRFAEAARPLRVLAPATLFFFATALFAAVLVLLERQRRLAFLGAGAVAANVVLNLLLIPRYSYMGAAAATLATEGATTLVMLVWIARYAGVTLDLSSLGRVAAATGGMSVVLWMAQDLPLIVALAAALGSYSVLAYLFGVVTRSDLGLLMARPAQGPESSQVAP